MAVITINFADIEGESLLAGYEGWSDAVGMRDAIEMPLVAGAGRTRGGRTSGTSNHSDLELIRFKDIASPKLAEACSTGVNIGSVTIHIFRMLEAGPMPYMTFSLTDTFVSRVETETLNNVGDAFLPTAMEAPIVTPKAGHGAGATAPRVRDGRLTIQPTAPRQSGAYTNQEIERLFLNPGSVTWEYSQFVGGIKAGSVAKGWDVERNTEAGIG